MYLYLTEPVPEGAFFGRDGYWLRLSRTSYREAPVPQVSAVKLNVVAAIQCQRAEDQYFDTGVYEAGKTIHLISRPVLDCQVWVDEGGALAVNDALALQAEMPERVQLERDGVVVLQCWVRWDQVEDLALIGPETRAFVLDTYSATISFGDGRNGRVPPHGDHNLRVSYHWGGGARGNVPVGSISGLVGSVPRIGGVVNLTAMSGGTDRFPHKKVEALGNRRLRHRGRAVGLRDFEEIVSEAFPQAMHVKCFSGLDSRGVPASGHVTLVVAGQDPEGGRVTADLCQRIYEYLVPRCSCSLTVGGRLHVCPSVTLTVSTQVTVELEELDMAAVTQQAIAQRLEHLMTARWQNREIGSQVRIDEVWQTVRETPNVRIIRRILIEGAYHQDGQPMTAALESDTGFPYATVRSGVHLVQVY